MTVTRELHYFALLTRTEQSEAIRRTASQRMSDYTISAATRLSVEFIRRVLAEQRQDVQECTNA